MIYQGSDYAMLEQNNINILNKKYLKDGLTEELIKAYAKNTFENISNLEKIPDKIRSDSNQFKIALNDIINETQNGKSFLKDIRSKAYNGQEKEALGGSRSKEEALSGELWFGGEKSIGLNKLNEKMLSRDKIIDGIIKPSGAEIKSSKLNIRSNLNKKLSDAFNLSKTQKPDGKKEVSKNMDKEEDFSRRRY